MLRAGVFLLIVLVLRGNGFNDSTSRGNWPLIITVSDIFTRNFKRSKVNAQTVSLPMIDGAVDVRDAILVIYSSSVAQECGTDHADVLLPTSSDRHSVEIYICLVV